MDRKIAANYSSSSQKIRVMTESWVGENIFCPYCGNKKIVNFENFPSEFLKLPFYYAFHT